jgi:NTE family protein
VFALIALSPSISIESIAREFRTRIAQLGLKCAILSEEAYEQPTAYFEDMEEKNDVVLLVARLQDSPWFRLVLRQADRLWLFARRDARPSSPMPLVPDEQSVARRFRLVDLVYLHEGSYDAATPADWIAAVGASRFFRWRTDADAARLVRVMIGRSVGLVLSGGGARAYAHVGVVRALREANIPIDFVGGTSMGAIIAAGVALGWPREEIDERLRDAFVTSNPLGDHHLPVVALVEGRIVDERLKKHFGEVQIEDLTLPMFCLSSDLVSGKARIHTSGLLREALRASIALPGILPPVAADGGLLVDGAVLNNFPSDVMQLMHRGLTVGCDVAQQGSIDPEDFLDPPSFARWIATHGFRDAPPIVSLLMRAATVGVNPNAGRKDCDLVVVPELSGIDIRDWKAYDRAVEAGYAATVKALQIAGNVLPRV